MKQIITILLVLLLTTVVSSTYAADIETEDYSFNILSLEEMTVEITAVKKSQSKIIIPSEIEYANRTLTVTKIGEDLFCNNHVVITVIIPSTLQTIGMYAFYGCSNLKELIIEDGEKELTIDNQKIVVPSFEGCNLLDSIYMGRNITFSSFQVSHKPPFSSCTSLRQITVGPLVTKLCSQLFSGCQFIKTIEIPDNVLTIGSDVFYGCNQLESVTLSNNLTSIPTEAFYGCSKLQNITLTSNIKLIGKDAFYGCGLTQLTIPSNVESIEIGAFYDTHIKKLNIEDSSKPLKLSPSSSGTFRAQFASKELNELYLGRDINFGVPDKSIPGTPFYNTLEYVVLGDSVSSILSQLFTFTQIKSLQIPSTVTSIGKRAFYHSSLQDIEIPASINTIGMEAFANCTNLETVTFDGKEVALSYGIFDNCTSLQNIKLPDLLDSIPPKSFENNITLSQFSFPKTLRGIAYDAFYGCSNLKDIVIDSPLRTISSSVFNGCTALTHIDLGDSIRFIGKEAFAGCPLETIVLGNPTVPTIFENSFDTKTYLSCSLYVPNEAIEEYQTADKWKNFWNIKSATEYNDINYPERGNNQNDFNILGNVIQFFPTLNDNTIDIYSANGTHILVPPTLKVNLTTGMYIVRIKTSIFKIHIP